MKMKIDNAICAMVEAFLPRFSSEKLGLFIEMNCGFDDHRKELTVRRFLQFIFVRSSNYTQVLFRDNHPPDDYIWNGKEFIWTQESHHDSCWRSDGMTKLFKTWCDSFTILENQGSKRKDISEYHNFSIFNTPTYVLFNQRENIRIEDPFGRPEFGMEKTRDWKVKIEKKLSLLEAVGYFPAHDKDFYKS